MPAGAAAARAAGGGGSTKEEDTAGSKKRTLADFEESQKVVKKSKAVDGKKAALEDLKRTSYWLADSQPDRVERRFERPPDRPLSPHSQTPLRRKDLWPVGLTWEDGKLVCAVSGKALKSSEVVAYWTDKKKKKKYKDDGEPGVVVLKSVYDELISDSMVCPVTSRKVRSVRTLQKSGTSFAASGQQVHVKKYAPTIT